LFVHSLCFCLHFPHSSNHEINNIQQQDDKPT
jgi:hypothetical protein